MKTIGLEISVEVVEGVVYVEVTHDGYEIFLDGPFGVRENKRYYKVEDLGGLIQYVDRVLLEKASKEKGFSNIGKLSSDKGVTWFVSKEDANDRNIRRLKEMCCV